MKNDVFITKLARGAVVSAMATCLAPQSHTDLHAAPAAAHELAMNDRVFKPDEGTQQDSENAVVLAVTEDPTEWDAKMEREFRKLALAEARGNLTAAQGTRLAELEQWRNRLLNGQSPEEILAQIKRDRLLEKMEALLKEYVQFQEATGQKRAAA
jgi:hypothetical protein